MATEALEVQAAARTAPSLPPGRQYPRQIRFSAGAEAYIADLAVDLLLNDLQLHQLPPSVFELWCYAYDCGRASRQQELDQATDDADRYYAEMCRRPPANHLQPYANQRAAVNR